MKNSSASRMAEVAGCVNRVPPGGAVMPIRPLFQHVGEAPHERAWCIDGVLHAYELEIIGGNYVLVLKVCA
jgi:hypothetical protein